MQDATYLCQHADEYRYVTWKLFMLIFEITMLKYKFVVIHSFHVLKKDVICAYFVEDI